MRTCFLLFFLSVVCVTAIAQTKTVTGTVRDQSGAPLAGATVTGKGTTIATATEPNGTFRLAVPEATKTIVISFTGMETQEVTLDGKPIDVRLALANGNNLNEVVVIGYGTVKRRDLTGSVASVTGKQLAEVPVANAAQALQGKLPGVNVTAQDGRPDATISIRVRGGGSISQTNDPLYIVDGFPVGSITDIPAAQIESIDVLKDASATAIYGSRGANGVIIITTKSGKSGKLTINYDGYAQFNEPTKYLQTMSAYDYVLYNWQYAKAISDSYAGAWERLWGIGAFAATANNPDGVDHYKNVAARNFSKDAYGSAFSHSHNLSVSNGTARSRYLLSMSYLDNEGMKINSFFKRANASFKLNQKISDHLDFSFDTRFAEIENMGNESTSSGRGSILSSSYYFRPIATKDVLGELDDRKNTQLGLYDGVLQDQYNPLRIMEDYFPLTKNRNLRSNVALSWTIIKGLVARSEFGYNIFWNKGETWSGAVYNNYLDADGNKTYAGNATLSSTEGWQLRWVNTLNYQVNGLGDKHDLSFTLGTEVNNSANHGMSMYGNKYPVSFSKERAFATMDQYLSSTTQVNSGISSSEGYPNRLNSYFGRMNYTFLDKYLFSFTMRADGSSRFAPNNRWAYFPAGAVAWRASDEEFLKDVKWLDNLKVRASYGSVGNDAISAAQWTQLWSSSGLTQWSMNEQRQTAYAPNSTLANPNLKWETTITRNIGLDFSLFDKRLYGTIDVYKNSSKNLLMYVTVDPTLGFSGKYDNVGATSNRGIEISLGGDIVRNKNFRLSASFNININHGQIDQLDPALNPLYKTNWGSTGTQPNTGDYILQVGQPVGLVRGYQYDGWYKTSDFTYANGVYTLNKGVPDVGSGILGTVYGTTANKPAGQSAYPGVVKFKDINGDGVVNEQDVSVIGNMNPKHTGGANINGSFKSLDFSLNFNWSYGNQVYNANYLAAFYGSKEDGLYRNRFDYLSTAWRMYDIQNGQIVKITDPAALNALNANATVFMPYHENPIVSTLGMQDGSFLRLNTVTVGYSLPQKWVHRIAATRIRVYGSIYNALTLTSYPGLDPEVNTNTSQNSQLYPTVGLDWGAYPRARSFTAGINVEF